MAEIGDSRRVVVTGLGAVTAIGETVADFWASLRQGRSGVAPVKVFPVNDSKVLPIEQYGEFKLSAPLGAQALDFNQRTRLKHFRRDKIIMHADRYSWLAAAAADEAVGQTGLELPFKNALRTACIIGSGLGGAVNLEIAYRHLYILNQRATHPLTLVRIIGSSAAAHVGIEYGVKGPTFATCSACASGAHAIGMGRDMIRHGLVDLAIVGASDAPHTFYTMRCWEEMNLLSPDGIFPFAKRRNGTVLGEGAGVLVLESLEHAKGRGAKVLAEVVGFGMTADNTDMIEPDADAPVEAMRLALEDARLAPSEIDYINAHGSGSVVGDRNETNAIKRVFGSHAGKLAISSTKSMHGHAIGGGGGVEAVACVKAIEEGWIPPTIGLDEPDPECDLDYVPNVGRTAKVEYVMSNSFAVGGFNGVLVFGPPPA
jgi:nodulation protein E